MPGMEQPSFYWNPSIAVCGLDFYRGELFEKWKNELLVGALKYEEVRLLNIENNRVMHEETILKGAGRVRDVSTGPDGAIYVVLNQPGKVVRLTPKMD
jgi:glucose/arabinose dehydrogenase